LEDIVYCHVEESFETALDLLTGFTADPENLETTVRIARMIGGAFEAGNKVIVFGNGGSAADAMHFAEEFTGRYRKDRRALPAIALADPTHITCVGNDYGFDHIFARGVEAHGKPGDIAVGLSTSGDSPNVANALDKAREIGLHTVALLGKDGGSIAGTCDLELVIPGATSDRIQEIHMLILHIVIEAVERFLFPELYPETHE
jgi:D-sedoheptulose 7-phosphate isomerase